MKKIMTIVTLCMATCTLWAQNEVSLVVSGEGKDKEEATFKALRSAIEQAYGTFVSANTTVLNDQLVADEIVSLSSGNIQKYEYVSENKMPNGNTFVTLSATVSIDKLVSFAESKGMEAELKGGLFAMSIKKMVFDKQAEEKAVEILCKQLEEMLPSLFNYEIKLEEPKLSNIEVNKQTSYDQCQKCRDKIVGQERTFSLIEQNLQVVLKGNENFDVFLDILLNTLKKITLDDNVISKYEKINLQFFKIKVPICKKYKEIIEKRTPLEWVDYNDNCIVLTFRSKQSIGTLLQFYSKIIDTLCPFVIKDNLHEFEIFWDNKFNNIVECKETCDRLASESIKHFYINPPWLLFDNFLETYNLKTFLRGRTKSELLKKGTRILSAKLNIGTPKNEPLLAIKGIGDIPNYSGNRRDWDHPLRQISLSWKNGYHFDEEDYACSIFQISRHNLENNIPRTWYSLGLIMDIVFEATLYYTQEEISKITHISVSKPIADKIIYNTSNESAPHESNNSSQADEEIVQTQSKLPLYNDTLQQAVNEYNTLLKQYPYNYNENRIAYTLSSELPNNDVFLRDTLHTLLLIISDKKSQLVERYKKDSLEFKQMSQSLQDKINEANAQLLNYPYNLQKRTLKDSLSINLFGKIEELTNELRTKTANLPKMQKQVEKEVYEKLILDDPQRFTEIYFTQNPSKKQDADKSYIECRCKYKHRLDFDMAFIHNTLPDCDCREKEYQTVSEFFHSREDFDQMFSQEESAYLMELNNLKSMMADKKAIEVILVNSKQLNFKKSMLTSNEDLKSVVNRINEHKGKYYYADVLDVVFKLNDKLAKEWEKNGKYFKSKAEMFECWISEEYDKVLKARKKE